MIAIKYSFFAMIGHRYFWCGHWPREPCKYCSFGDYVSDQVVAPVRETCAQVMGAMMKQMPRPLVIETLNILLQMQVCCNFDDENNYSPHICTYRLHLQTCNFKLNKQVWRSKPGNSSSCIGPYIYSLTCLVTVCLIYHTVGFSIVQMQWYFEMFWDESDGWCKLGHRKDQSGRCDMEACWVLSTL